MQPSSVCVHVRACAQVSELGALSPPTLCPPSPGSQPSSPAALSQIGLNRQTLGICSWNGLLTLGPWGWDLGSPFESLCLSGCLVLSNFRPFPAAWTMDPGNRRDTSSPPTGSVARAAHRSPPACAESKCGHLASVSSLPLSWPHPQKALAQAPAAPPTHSVTLDLSGWPLGMGIREQNIQGRGGSVVQ